MNRSTRPPEVTRQRGQSRPVARRVWLAAATLLFALAAGPAQAAVYTFTVTDISDAGAATGGGQGTDGICDAQGSAACTLRAALEEANAIGGANTFTINFAIGTGLQTITPGSPLPPITSVVTIDGTTQGGYAVGGLHPIQLSGASAGAGAIGLDVGANGRATIIGLTINRFGTAIRFSATTGNVVAGCYVGTNPTGMAAGPGNWTGVRMTTGNNQIDGTLAAGPNVISGNARDVNNAGDGIQIDGVNATTNTVKGNYIGVAADGTTALGNGWYGLSVANGAKNNTIGGPLAVDRNVISGNGWNHASPNYPDGIQIYGSGTTGNLVQGNYIGTDVTGNVAVRNYRYGIRIDTGATDNTIDGNTIAHNDVNGVWMNDSTTVRNSLLRNRIFANYWQGIELYSPTIGIDINDTGDADVGPNDSQNHPVLSAAMTNKPFGGTSATIAGSYNSAANTTYRVEFFAGTAASQPTNPNDYGPGERYLGFTLVTTDANGNAAFGVTLAPVNLDVGDYVTSTATVCTNMAPGCAPFGSTSEFGRNVVAVGSLVVTTTDDTDNGDTTSVSALIANPGAPDYRVSLREAIEAANASGGTIRFGIPITDAGHFYYKDNLTPGSLPVVLTATTLADFATPASRATSDFDPDYPLGLVRSWYRIRPTSALPAISATVSIDGASNPDCAGGGPVIQLDGSLAGPGVDGLTLTGSNSTVRYLVIDNFSGHGIRINGGDGNTMAGNYVGTNVTGTAALANGIDGILVNAVGANGAVNNVIGGTAVGDRNIVSGNHRSGIEVLGTSTTGNSILGNAIYGNDALGIDLGGDGVTPNDASDADIGPNDFLNHPVITSVNPVGGALTVTFSLDAPAGSYRIEFFRNPSGADPSGSGEGQVFASSRNVTHPGGGALSFSHSFAGSSGDVITATTTACTDGATCSFFGGTSEFARAQVAVATACGGAALQLWYNAGWSYRKVILIDHTKVLADLVDFPVLVSRNGDADLAAHARPDGFDILFTDEDGTTKLSHQIESYGAGNLVAWVKVPLLPTAADKLIFMYFGNASSPDQQSVNATWTNGYRGVWHLKETPTGAAGEMKDSTINANNGRGEVPGSFPTQTAGKIDGSLAFDGSLERAVGVTDNASLRLVDMTVSAWAKTGSTDGQARLIVCKWNSGTSSANYWLGKLDASNMAFGVHSGGVPNTVYAALGLVNDNAWHHVVGVVESSTTSLRLYIDGVQRDAKTYAGPIQAGTSDLKIGRSSDTALQDWNGGIDEVRVSNLARTVAWIQTEYNNQLSPSSFCAVCGAQNVGTTAVRLASFTARGVDSSVLVEWETASELDNLGFHLYRGLSADGPWTKLNASIIPGLGSSPEGRQYRWVDGSLTNGTTYFYSLEDLDRHGQVTSHGPVSATPLAGVTEPGEGSGGGPVEPPGSSSPAPQRKTYGDPTQHSLRILERTASGVTLELRTGGFYSEEQPDGTSRLLVPGFFDHAEPGRPTVPTRRLWVDAVVGRGVRLVSVEPGETVSFPGLDVTLAGKPVAVTAADGTYRTSSIPVSREEARRLARGSGDELFPAAAFVHQTAFQGERKKAYVELAPVQVDPATGEITLARRLLVRLAFAGRVPGEQGQGSLGRSAPVRSRTLEARVLARLATRSRGLYTVAFEEIPGLVSPVSASDLRLSRLGVGVAFHLEPRGRPFGPGSVLYFHAEGADSAYGTEAVYELAVGSGGIQMPGIAPSRPVSNPIAVLRHERSFEKNAVYLPALVEARDLWLWDYGIGGGQGISYPFTLDSLVPARAPARLTLDLQGGSDTEIDPDHHVLVIVNGSLVGETRFDGMAPHSLALDVPTSLLLEGENILRLENAGDTGSTASFVYLDRFSIEVPEALALRDGVLEGQAAQSGRASVEAAAGAVVLDLTGSAPRFLARSTAEGRLSWNAEADHHYLAVSPEAFLRPEVRPALTTTLRSPANQADWMVLAPEALLPATEALVALRQSQGLTATAVSYETVVDEFGYGEAGPQAIQSFLAFAFHHWQVPSLHYVLLLGDASYDPKGRLSNTSRPDLLPSPLVKSTYLWTAADPLYAAVNGEDSLPDLAIGRINAATLEEAQAAVAKILAFETSGRTLAGKAALVADNGDLTGDFEQDQNEIARLLTPGPVEKLYLSQLGAAETKAAVRNAFDAGLSLMSYVGHGSSGLWASEGILRSPDVDSFSPQPAQPLVLTMTCSNGYFLSPYYNSLAERLVLADGKGAIAAFSPSGLSLNEAAQVYHRAVVSELETGQFERLGDLLLAAQVDYAATGAFPELLQVYTLFGDPGLRVR